MDAKKLNFEPMEILQSWYFFGTESLCPAAVHWIAEPAFEAYRAALRLRSDY
jgi:hypothetical protein